MRGSSMLDALFLICTHGSPDLMAVWAAEAETTVTCSVATESTE
jgi:hypothetical protein